MSKVLAEGRGIGVGGAHQPIVIVVDNRSRLIRPVAGDGCDPAGIVMGVGLGGNGGWALHHADGVLPLAVSVVGVGGGDAISAGDGQHLPCGIVSDSGQIGRPAYWHAA